jgi:hypothetical protein
MRPQDVAVLLKIVAMGDRPWRYADLSQSLFISQSEVAEALNRCFLARLVDAGKRKVFRASLTEFLTYGVKYVFPAQPGAMVRGIATAHSASPLRESIVSQEDLYVWPHPEGSVRGQSIEPLYPKVIQAAQQDPHLYELLTLLDGVRVGRAREYRLAVDMLNQRIKEVAYVRL